VTGLTRNGVWLVEDGRVVRPVTNLRFTQSYLEALGPGNVRGVGSDLTLVSGGAFGIGAYAVPSLHLASWNFTGGASGRRTLTRECRGSASAGARLAQRDAGGAQVAGAGLPRGDLDPAESVEREAELDRLPWSGRR
jgi:hypothetical protein